jgi:HEAT repeat protein
MKLNDLLVALKSGSEIRAEAAAREIAALGTEALPALKEMLASSDFESRWWATRALAEISDPQVVPLLLDELKDPDLSVRQCAALALRVQASPLSVPQLVGLLGDRDRLLAHLASDALTAIGREAVPALLEVMESGEHLERLEAERALARIGDPRAIPALFAALSEESALMEHWANEGLERMGVGMAFFKPS